MSTTRINGADGVIIAGDAYLELPKGSIDGRPLTSRAGMVRYNFSNNDSNRRGMEVCIGNEAAVGSDLEWRPVAVLNPETGRLDSSLLPASIQGAMEYKGIWNSATNTPALPALPDAVNGKAGAYYIVSEGGNGNGANNIEPEDAPYVIGDWVVSTGTVWDKINYNNTSTTAGEVVLQTNTFRPGVHAMMGANLVQTGFERLTITALDRFGDTVEGTITFNNASSTAYLRIKDGNAATPGIAFSSDTNTGLYKVTADQLGISAGGISAVVVSPTNTQINNQLLEVTGSDVMPSYSFIGDDNTGMYRESADVLAFSAGGVKIMGVSSGGLSANRLLLDNGTAALPAYSFKLDPDTGIYTPTANTLNFSTGGTSRLSLGTTSFDISVNARAISGTAALPAFSFISDPNTGMYNPSADTIAFSVNGIEQVVINAHSSEFKQHLHAPAGTNLLPSYSFTANDNTGMYSPAIGNVGIVADGVNTITYTSTNISPQLPILALAGTAAKPPYSFINDSDSGIYSKSAGVVAISTDGTNVVDFSTATTSILNQLNVKSGSLANLSLSFTGNADTGLYSADASSMSLVVDGVTRLKLSTSSITTDLPIYHIDGTVLAPSITFANDTNTGVYRVGNDVLGITVGGVNKLTVQPASVVSSVPLVTPKGVINGNVALSEAAHGFTGDTNTGLYSPSTGVVGLMASGVEKIRVNATSIVSSVVQNGTNGTVTDPQYSFTASASSGLYSPATNQVALSAGGASVLSATSTLLTLQKPVSMGINNTMGWYGSVGGKTSTISTTADAGRLVFTASDTTEAFTFGNGTKSYMKILPGALQLPVSISSEIAAPADGMFRFDNATKRFLGYAHGDWSTIEGPGGIDDFGSIGAPSISWRNDPDTGFYRSAENEISVVTGGVVRFVFSPTGNRSAGPLTATSFIGPISGNATSATVLQNARTINGVSFNGSANITVYDDTKLPLTGGTLSGALTAPTFNGALNGNATTATNANNANTLGGASSAEAATPSTIAKRDVSGDVSARLFKSSYNDEPGISGALAYRVNNSTDQYIRFCSDTTTIRAWLGAAPTTHTHAWSQITSPPVYTTRWPTASEAGAAPAVHTHNWSQISDPPVYTTRWPTAAEVGIPADRWTLIGSGTCDINLQNSNDYKFATRIETGVPCDSRNFDPGKYRIVLITNGLIETSGDTSLLWWSARGDPMFISRWSGTEIYINVYVAGGHITGGKVSDWRIYKWQ